MNLSFRPLICCVLFLTSAGLGAAETKPTTTSILPAGLTLEQVTAGLKTGLGFSLDAALGQLSEPDAVSVSTPPTLAKIEAALKKLNKSEATNSFTASLTEAANKVSPQAAALIRESFANVSIDDAMGVLKGGSTAGTQFFRKAVSSPLRAKLLPLVSQATASTGVGTKAKEMLAQAGPFASMLGKPNMTDIDGYVCDQVLDTAFNFMGQQETALRANPALAKNALVQKVFALAAK